MRATTLSLCLGLILLAGVAAGEEKPAKDVRENCTASAAYVQDDFFRNLKENLAEGFSKSRREKMMATLGKQGLSSGEVLELMNGSCSDRELRKHLGVSRGDTDRVRAALDETVKEKDKNAFFGIMTEIMIGNFDVDPSGEFAQQACGAKDEISDETMNKILKKANTSRRTMKEAFGFKDKDDQKFMADIIKAAMINIHAKMKQSHMKMARSGHWKARLVLQVHDELIFELPKSEVKAFGKGVRSERETAIQLKVPVLVDVKSGPNWNKMESVKL